MNEDIFMSFARFKKLTHVDEQVRKALDEKWLQASYQLKPATTQKNIKNNITVLEELREFIQKQCDKHDLDFPDIFNFIDAYKNSSIVCTKTVEKSDVPTAILKSFRSKYSQSSIIKLAQEFNYQQLRTITKELFERNNALIFPIPQTEEVEGKVIGEVEQRRIKIPVAWLIEIKTKEESLFVPYIFGENLPRRAKVVDELTGEFYLYRFLTKDSKEFALVSIDKLKLDDYTVKGLAIDVEDSKILGDAYRLLSKYPVFFIHTAQSHICELKNHDELFAKADELKLTGNKLYQYLCSYKKDKKVQLLEHPKWFLKLTAAFLFHSKKGNICPYPLHLLWISDRGAGKTTYMESLHQKSGEAQEIIAGSSSTIKYLIPSFKETNRPEMGALAKASRMVFVDEFFRIVRVNNKDKESECGRMNDLLEHKDRLAGSGQGRIRTSMTARLLASTNPIAGTNTITNLIEKFDDAFLSRFLIYYQTDDHVKLIHRKKKEPKQYTKDWIEVNDLLSVQDYLQSFDASYELKRLVEIYDKFLVLMSEKVKGVYEARYLHHMECLIDGIIKTRCLTTRDKTFKAIDEDYQDLEAIWTTMIQGWYKEKVDEVLRDPTISVEAKYNILPEEAMFILRKLASMGYKVKSRELHEACKKEMRGGMISIQMSLLKEAGFVRDDGEYVIHHEWEVGS